MKTIQISQLKGENFDIHKLIESCVVIDKEDLNINRTRFKELIKDLESLNEALFFKQEKLNLQQKSIKEKLEVDKIKKLVDDLQDLDIGVLGKSKEVLERNKEIYELKLINKMSRYFTEIEKGNFTLLKILIQSDDKDDWKFLAFFLQKTIDLVTEEIKIKLNEVKADLEKKLFDVFEQGRKSKNRTIMKSSYVALSELDLEHTLIQTFIYDLEIFKSQPVLKNQDIKIIDLDFYDEEINDFFEFINNVRNTYQDELSGLENIFSDYDKAYKIINTKLYYDLIFPILDNYLNNNNHNPFIFLYSLEKSYLNLVNLGNYIETISTKFDSKIMIDELKERYSVIALEKERSFFKEIFECLINGKPLLVKYIILGEEVKFNRDFKLILKQLLNLINQFLNRSQYFYAKDDVYDMFSFYSGYLIQLLNIIFDEKDDKVETILQIKYIYLMVKRFYGKNFSHSFSSRTEDLIKKSFKWKIEQCEGRIKQIINQIYFYKIESDLYLLEYLKTQIDDLRRIKGKNFAIFCKNIFRFAFTKIKKRILEISFGDLQKSNLKNFKNKFEEYVDLLGISEIQNLFRYLESIILIITINKEDLNELVNAFKIKMDIDDIKMALKCRKDGKSVVI